MLFCTHPSGLWSWGIFKGEKTTCKQELFFLFFFFCLCIILHKGYLKLSCMYIRRQSKDVPVTSQCPLAISSDKKQYNHKLCKKESFVYFCISLLKSIWSNAEFIAHSQSTPRGSKATQNIAPPSPPPYISVGISLSSWKSSPVCFLSVLSLICLPRVHYSTRPCVYIFTKLLGLFLLVWVSHVGQNCYCTTITCRSWEEIS